MKIDANIVVNFGKGEPMKLEIKSLVAGLIKKGLLAVGKLVKTKLFPKAEEKYCRVLQVTSEKLVNKVSDIVDDLDEEKDSKKRTRKLYILKLCVNTMEAIQETFSEVLNLIKACVNFDELENNESQDEIALAVKEAGGELENTYEDYVASLNSGCGPDGCEIV